MIKFCHIVPTSYLPLVERYDTHLLLAHLVEEDVAYRDFYIKLKESNPKVKYHLDNSAFEMFKRGEPMYPSKKLIEMGKLVKADSIVMSDYPKMDYTMTVESANNMIPKLKKAGFQTFFCPQSELGDLEGLMKSFEWAINNINIDYIGVSILACPIGLGVNEEKHGDGSRDEAYRLQRYLSRFTIFQELETRGLLSYKTRNRFHCLGMTEGPREINLLKPFHKDIFSWDSSSAVWHAINGIKYDHSPTGLIKGKLDKEVDFDIEATTSFDTISRIAYNMDIVDEMCRGGRWD